MTKYNEDSIKEYTPLEFTRIRSDTYLGSNDDSTQLVLEIVTNCIDEHLIGNCNTIYVNIDEKNNIVTVKDDGQGILPNVVKESGRTVLENVYGSINSSGKTDKTDKNNVYKVSTGAFGIGATLTNYLSHWLTAVTRVNGEFEKVHFVEGVFNERESGTCDKNEHGVEVSFQPSEEFFVKKEPNEKKLKTILNNICCICPKLVVYFNNEKIEHPEGINDLITEKINSEIEKINSRCVFDIENNIGQKLNLGLTFTGKSDSTFVGFCNYGLIENGAPVTAIKSCITRCLNKWGHEQGLLKEKDSLSGNALQEGIVVVFNLVSSNIRYDSQTKVRCTSTEDNPFINEVLSKELEL